MFSQTLSTIISPYLKYNQNVIFYTKFNETLVSSLKNVKILTDLLFIYHVCYVRIFKFTSSS